MSCHIHCEWDGYVQFCCQLFEVVVCEVECVFVLQYIVFVTFLYDGEQVAAFRRFVFVDYVLHTFLPSYGELLSCFSSSVCKDSVCQVAFFQERHVDERHASCVEAEEEEVACKFLTMLIGKVHVFQLLH